jgi:hypothetical protein
MVPMGVLAAWKDLPGLLIAGRLAQWVTQPLTVHIHGLSTDSEPLSGPPQLHRVIHLVSWLTRQGL